MEESKIRLVLMNGESWEKSEELFEGLDVATFLLRERTVDWER